LSSSDRNRIPKSASYGAKSGVMRKPKAGDLETVGVQFAVRGLVDGPVEVFIENGPPVGPVGQSHRVAGVLCHKKKRKCEYKKNEGPRRSHPPPLLAGC
jgi:hypothetical protein